MEFNRCSRCGAFFVAENNICPNCEPKDACEKSNLKNYLENNQMPESLEILSNNTGISTKNLNRFLENIENNDLNISL